MKVLPIATLCLLAWTGSPQESSEAKAAAQRVAHGVAHLRHAVGEWSAKTEFLNEDGSVAGSVEGTYSFRWVVPDRVLAGESEIPSLRRKSAILFYVNVEKELIEMSSVSADGELWVMTGPIDGEVRTTATKEMPDQTRMQLRFTRSAVEADRFESTMEFTTDDGKQWKPGNHQVFERRK
jgi:hypothetical protein